MRGRAAASASPGPKRRSRAFQLGQVDELIITGSPETLKPVQKLPDDAAPGEVQVDTSNPSGPADEAPAEAVGRTGHARAADRGAHPIHRRRDAAGRCRWRRRAAEVPHMSRQNKVNPGMYTQRGRLTQDDAAREMKKQRDDRVAAHLAAGEEERHAAALTRDQ